MTDRTAGRPPRWQVAAALAAVAVAAQLWGLYRVSGPPAPAWFPHADKLEHAVGFAAPVALTLAALGLRRRARAAHPSRRPLFAVVAVFGAHAVVSELIQGAFYTSRAGDPLDVAADWAGVAVGAVVGSAVLRRGAGHPPVVAETHPGHSRAGAA